MTTCSAPGAPSWTSCAPTGIDPFPHAYPGVAPIADVHAAHDGLEDGAETEERVRLAGRLVARRGQGKMAFLDLEDRSGRMQLQSKVDVLGAREARAAAVARPRRPDRRSTGASSSRAAAS